MLLQPPLVLVSKVLAPAVRVMNEAPGGLVASDSLLKGLCYQPLRHARSQGIAYDLAMIKILQGREIQRRALAGGMPWSRYC